MEGTPGVFREPATSGIARTHASGEFVDANPSAQPSEEVLPSLTVLLTTPRTRSAGYCAFAGFELYVCRYQASFALMPLSKFPCVPQNFVLPDG